MDIWLTSNLNCKTWNLEIESSIPNGGLKQLVLFSQTVNEELVHYFHKSNNMKVLEHLEIYYDIP